MPRQLGELEDAVMTRVWQWNRPVTVREVLEDLQRERSIAYTTVMTVMDNLHQKGWVRREVDGRAYRYTAVSTRAAYSAALMNDAWSRSDNPAAALVAFFGMMSAEQREALRDAVRIVSPGTGGAVAPPAPPAGTGDGAAGGTAGGTGDGASEAPAEVPTEPAPELLTEPTPELPTEPSPEVPTEPTPELPTEDPADGTAEDGGR
ncbi:BlaI/MecI/CopY family transcriptional regulator [Streptomyces sp. NBC_01335]|uniref:BlaI/MecI/CopY family transcriptional regulator n=1 Tax=Streptomyces sp. NBC_01335 TaxID=2903828 RepID=UPI002E165506|nr:BlaI/MecI/CopY family transcriptional regulator [Streptomyces sp. NBC_01335]